MRVFGRGCFAAAMAAALLGAGGASAAVVIDPVTAPIGPGLRAGITPFAVAPATGTPGRLAALQSLRALNDGSGRLFVTDTRGLVSVTTTAGAAPRPWFDIRTQGVAFAELNSQAGLVSTAFHPNFAGDKDKPGYGVFYTIYTTEASAGTPDYAGNGPVNHHDVLREWRVADPAAPVAQIAESREVLRVAQPLGDHGPGTIAFNPAAGSGSADYGRLYIGLGDGGGVGNPFGNAQDLGSPFGKILRIDPADPDGAGPLAYSVPLDNPFVGRAGALGEVWASGLRNPQQFDWDPLTGAMYIADIGQAALEEVNLGRAGADYGWSQREGTFGRSATDPLVVTDDPNLGGFVDPIAQYDHGEGDAISGALVYRGTALPGLYGRMLVSDLVTGRLFSFALGDTSGQGGLPVLTEVLLDLAGAPISLLDLAGPDRVDLRMGVDTAGEVYLLTKRDGAIFRLVAPAGAGAVPEPATWAMLILGFGLVGGLARRRSGRHFASVTGPESLYPRDGRYPPAE